jgi:hypothetical protein
MRFSVLVTLASLSLCEPGQQTQTSGLPGDSGVAPSAPTPALTTPFEPQTRNAIGGDGVSSSQAKKAVSDNQNSAEHVDGATTQQTVAPREPNERVSENGSEPHFTTMNEVILDVLVGMPKGGGYDSSPDGMSTRNLGSSHTHRIQPLDYRSGESQAKLLFLRYVFSFSLGIGSPQPRGPSRYQP